VFILMLQVMVLTWHLCMQRLSWVQGQGNKQCAKGICTVCAAACKGSPTTHFAGKDGGAVVSDSSRLKEHAKSSKHQDVVLAAKRALQQTLVEAGVAKANAANRLALVGIYVSHC
jgi:hypothetical protein